MVRPNKSDITYYKTLLKHMLKFRVELKIEDKIAAIYFEIGKFLAKNREFELSGK